MSQFYEAWATIRVAEYVKGFRLLKQHPDRKIPAYGPLYCLAHGVFPLVFNRLLIFSRAMVS